MDCKYLKNGDEIIEADNGKLILANSGAYCDEEGNPIGGNMDDDYYENAEYVYITAKGKTYHKTEKCPSLNGREVFKIPISEIGDRKPCKRCNK